MWTRRDNKSTSNSSIRNQKDYTNSAPHNLVCQQLGHKVAFGEGWCELGLSLAQMESLEKKKGKEKKGSGIQTSGKWDNEQVLWRPRSATKLESQPPPDETNSAQDTRVPLVTLWTL